MLQLKVKILTKTSVPLTFHNDKKKRINNTIACVRARMDGWFKSLSFKSVNTFGVTKIKHLFSPA